VNRCIMTYAAGAHEELLDVALPTYRAFADRHRYDLVIGKKMTELLPAWNKVLLLLDALKTYKEVVWFDCDLVVVDSAEDFPPMGADPTTGTFTQEKLHSMVRHFEDKSEVPNSGVWRLRRHAVGLWAEDLLNRMMMLEVFTNHGWWEQAALLTLMGYCVPPEGTPFEETKCRCVHQTTWYRACQFMRLCWNSHPMYRAEHPRIVHCSYPRMAQRLEVMRVLVRDPTYDYPKFEVEKEDVDTK